MNVVVVESPAKAKTINKYLGPDYQVLASLGHVRDLPAKDGSVRPDEDFAMIWQVDAKAEKRLAEIARAVKQADRLILATDPDREGEAISWHIAEELKRRKALNGVEVARVVFNEVTKTAVLEAMRHPRGLDKELIDAYLARRALDYLVGFTLSPVLWRKLPGSRSAGRVQSVALRLICEREAEIEAFKPQEYWTVEAKFKTPAGATFGARLTHLDGRKLDKFDLGAEAAAATAVARLMAGDPFTVANVERKTLRRNPFPPFTTSTLQQEASRKLGFGATHTMRLAQRLYEGIDVNGEAVGLITYMRTDGVQLSQEAIAAARGLIARQHGDKYLPESPRIYKSTVKNAQEAHEAIRPTDVTRRPDGLTRAVDRDQLRLYELIWKRTLASQMASAVIDQVGVDIAAAGGAATLRATGSVIVFDGFLALYQEDRDEPAEDDETDRRLPPLSSGETVARDAVVPAQHFTQPPPRFSEASLVKRLEELGIGRPSTYASILQVLQDRDYVRLEKRRFQPEDRGRLVTAFLTSFFERYVQYNFTAELEDKLDDISGGRIEWKTVLRGFWGAFSEAIEETRGLRIAQVIDALDEELGRHFFPEDGNNPRQCPACQKGRLSLKLGRYGAFVGCSNYPECRYTRPLAMRNGENGEAEAEGPRELGRDPATGLAVSLRRGPYGHYVQLGEANGDAEAKPKRVSLPRGLAPGELDLDRALALLALPREIGKHPETGEPIVVGIGRFGPYVKHGRAYKSLGRDDDVFSIGANRAVALLAEAKGRGPAGTAVGDHPADGKPITLHSGRYGPYVRHGKQLASLPKSMSSDELTVEAAVRLLAEQAERAKAKRGGKAPRAGAAKRPRAAKTVKAAAVAKPAPRRRGKSAAKE
ncbi:MAG TPA: type I DNA topoisomerase [Dongiaceae bacterium]|nr:type I DNA topoisomerase [Dongiaceae bacterium]